MSTAQQHVLQPTAVTLLSATLLRSHCHLAAKPGKMSNGTHPSAAMMHIMCRTSNREVIELSDGLFGASVTTSTAKPSMAVMLRQTHGILMAVNFIVVFPLGALAARQLRCHWLRSPVIRAAMFYVHVFTQVRRATGALRCEAHGL